MAEVLQSIWFLKVEYDKQKAYNWLSRHNYTEKRPLKSRGSNLEYQIRPINLFDPRSLHKKHVDGITFIYGRYRGGIKGLKTGIKTFGGIKEHSTSGFKVAKPSPSTQEKAGRQWQEFFRKTILPIIGTESLSGEYQRRKRALAPQGVAEGEGIKKKGMGGFKV